MNPYPSSYTTWTAAGAYPVHHTSTLAALGIVVISLAVELATIGVVMGWAAITARHRRNRHWGVRRATKARCRSDVPDDLAALDADLDRLWVADVAARRRQAVREMVRLADCHIPLVGASTGEGEAANGSTRFVFADGTVLAVWPPAGGIPSRTLSIRKPAVLGSHPRRSDAMRFVTAAGEVVIHGEVLIAGGSEY